jgi:hypothetical protein
MVTLQPTQDISVSSGLRSSFIDARVEAVGSAIMALDNAMGIGRLTLRQYRSRASVPDRNAG